MERGTVVFRLTGWARWKFKSGEALGYPSMCSFTRLGGASSRPSYDDVDSFHVETDRAFESLDQEHKEIIRMEYLSIFRNVSNRARQMGVCRSTYYGYLNVAYDALGKILEKNLQRSDTSDTFLLNQLEMRQQGAK